MKPKTIKGQVRQGDLLLAPATKPTAQGEPVTGHVTLALGEVTGHAHVIDASAGEQWKRGNEVIGVALAKPASLKHQEHGPLKITPSFKRVIKQREYTPAAPRNVAD